MSVCIHLWTPYIGGTDVLQCTMTDKDLWKQIKNLYIGILFLHRSNEGQFLHISVYVYTYVYHESTES